MKRLLRGALSDVTYQAKRFSPRVNRGLRVLMYHRVTDHHPEDRLCVPVAQFIRHMHFLQKNGVQTISLTKAVRWMMGLDAVPSSAMVLTFDDGYADNFLYAAPAMERYGLTGVFFVPTEFIQSGRQAGRYEEDQPMTWDQLRRLIRQGHEVGAHSVTHRLLTSLEPGEITGEIWDSKTTLEGHLGQAVEHFCYPAGQYDDAIRQTVLACGYLSACTIEPGANLPGEDPFTLRRTEISPADSLWDVKKKLMGAYDWLHAAVQGVHRIKTRRRSQK